MSMCNDEIIKTYFNRKNVIVDHQINSYNYYVDTLIPQIISQFFPVIIPFKDDNCVIKEVKLDVSNIRVGKPLLIENNGCSKLMTPNMARVRNSTYISPITVDFNSIIKIQENSEIIELEKTTIKNILFGKVPIMVKSKYCILNQKGGDEECKYDVGGYFIINGNEKVIISQEKIANNLIQVYKNPKNYSKYSHICETRSLNENTFGIPKVASIKITNKSDIYSNQIKILLPHMKTEIPIFILMRALGCESDKEIIYHVIDNNNSSIDMNILKILKPSIEEAREVMTENEAVIYISKFINNNSYYTQNEEKKINYVKDCI